MKQFDEVPLGTLKIGDIFHKTFSKGRLRVSRHKAIKRQVVDLERDNTGSVIKVEHKEAYSHLNKTSSNKAEMIVTYLRSTS